MARSRKPKRKASRKKSRSPKRSIKKCPPGCVKRKVARKVSRKRRSVKRKVSRKRRSVKRKVSRKRRKRRSVKRKVSRKRRSVKRKVSRKRRSVKRKVSRKRRSMKRKVSRKRRSAKRKSSAYKFRLTNNPNKYRQEARKHNSRCDRIAKNYIKKFFDISNKLYNLQNKLGCGDKRRDRKGKFISRHPYATPLNIPNIMALMNHLHPIKRGGNRALSRASSRGLSRASSRGLSRASSRGLSGGLYRGLSKEPTRRMYPTSSRGLSRGSTRGSSRSSVSRRLDLDFDDLIDSMSTSDLEARTPSRIGAKDAEITNILTELSEERERRSFTDNPGKLSQENLAEHNRRLATAGLDSPLSTSTRDSSDIADTDTVILADSV